MSASGSQGVLRDGWSTSVNDYAIAGGWVSSGDGFVVGDAAGGVYAFDGKSGDNLWSKQDAHDGGVLAMSICSGGTRFASAGQDGRVLVWGVEGDRPKHTIDAGNTWVENIAWAPNGRWLAATCGRQVRVYDALGSEIWRSDNHPSTISAIAWAGTGELATACYGQVAFFDIDTGIESQKLEWKGSLVSLVLSPDGDIVACGSQDNSVHFWRRSTARDSMISGYAGKPTALAFDAAGLLLASGGGERVTVWSFQGGGPEGTRPGELDLHIKPVTALAFAHRGMRLASGGRDGAVVVWSLQSNGEGGPIGAAVVEGVVAELYWRKDGRALAALDARGGVTVWRTA